MALYKRGNIYWMSFQHEGKHIQKSTGCRNIRDAKAFERAYRTQLAFGEVGIKARVKPPSFCDAVDKYLEWARNEHRTKPNTIRSYESTSKALVQFFSDKAIDEVELGDVEAFKEWRSKQATRPRNKPSANIKSGRLPKRNPTTLKPATVNRELALLKIIFNFYIRRGVLVKNPVSLVRFFAEDNCQIRVVTPEEERLYLMAASQPLQDFAIVMIDTGMRPEEVARIEAKNVNLTSGYVFIPFGKTKAAKRRIPLSNRVSELLSKRLNEMSGEYLFANETTQCPLTTLKTAHAGALRRAELPHFRIYDLRHTFATRFIESGGDIVTLQALLGHANIQMVTRYAHPTENHQFQAMKRMETVRLENEANRKARRA